MVNGLLMRIAIGLIAFISFAQATPISLGFIEFKDSGAGGTLTKFTFNNWSNGIGGYPVISPVNFTNVSFTIDRQGAPPEQAVNVPLSMAPSPTAYVSDVLDKSFVITRAIFHATLNPADIWALNGGGYFVPQSSQLDLVLLPSNSTSFRTPMLFGPAATPGDSWEILVDSQAQPNPEPATVLLSAGGLVGLWFVQRRRRA
jgi:hypothetical protein